MMAISSLMRVAETLPSINMCTMPLTQSTEIDTRCHLPEIRFEGGGIEIVRKNSEPVCMGVY